MTWFCSELEINCVIMLEEKPILLLYLALSFSPSGKRCAAAPLESTKSFGTSAQGTDTHA